MRHDWAPGQERDGSGIDRTYSQRYSLVLYGYVIRAKCQWDTPDSCAATSTLRAWGYRILDRGD